ncbi:MAG: DUF4157 domain-containing protein [Dehalococcoidia bacterium]|nr:DUF4157 domain-containing protein [Dehalococcoidia bacterium]
MPQIDDALRPALLRHFSLEEVQGCQLHFRGLVVGVISLPGLRRRSAAITFGREVFLRPDNWQRLGFSQQVGLLAHELTHVRQYRRWGGAPFLAWYALLYPFYFWRVNRHPLERPAYRMGSEVVEAVRRDSAPRP